MRMFGTVEFFNNPKGWGIIKTPDNVSFFVHHRDITEPRFFPNDSLPKYRTLKPGCVVSFVQKQTDRPMNQAVDVVFAETALANDA